jgi:outer membrane receptor protein involved in Fe transport
MKTIKTVITFLMTAIAGLSLVSATGSLSGTVTENGSKYPLIGATVVIDGTSWGSLTDDDGHYQIKDVPAGTYTVVVNYVGYESIKIPNVNVAEGQTITKDIVIGGSDKVMKEFVIKKKKVKNTESAVINMQIKSDVAMDGIGATEFAKHNASNAAKAASRIAGVSVEDGKYVYVRGLSDRYSKTTLNGCEIPGLDPERNVVQMDIFPTSMIQNMLVYKSFAPNLKPFTGGLVDIQTNDFPEKKYLQLNVAFTVNNLSSFRDDFLTYEGGKLDGLAIDDGSRDFAVNPSDIILYPVNREELDETTKKFDRDFDVTQKNSFMDQSYSFSYGDTMKIAGRLFGYGFGAGYKNNLRAYTNGQRGVYSLPDPDAKVLNTEQQYNEQMGQTNVLINTMFNAGYRITKKATISYLFSHVRSSSKGTYYRDGIRPADDEGLIIQNREQGFKERAVSINQIKGSFEFARKSEDFDPMMLNVVSSFISSRQNEPGLNYFTNSYYPDAEVKYELNPSIYKVPSTFNRGMGEYNIDNQIHLMSHTKLGSVETKFKTGATFVYKRREFTEERVDFLSQVQYFNGNVSEYTSESNIGLNHPLYNGESRQYYGLYVQDGTDKRNSYDGYQSITAGYAMGNFEFGSRLKLATGVRFERTDMTVQSRDEAIEPGLLLNNDLLPAANFTFKVIKNMNLRLGISRTLSRPSFREIAPFAAFSPVAPTLVGNPNLKRSLIDNYDFKWEFSKKRGELFAASVFYKTFYNPIEMVDNPVAINPEISFQNVDQAQVYGFETSLKKSLAFVPGFDAFSIGVNYTYIRSEVNINPEELKLIRALIPDHPDKRPLFGQSPYIFNASLNYTNDSTKLRSTISYNVSGQKVALITKGGTPDVFEMPFHSLNYNITKTVMEKFQLKLSINNILGSNVQQL